MFDFLFNNNENTNNEEPKKEENNNNSGPGFGDWIILGSMMTKNPFLVMGSILLFGDKNKDKDNN